MSGRRLFHWVLPAGLGLLAAGLLAAGFSAALSGKLGTPVGEAPTAVPTPRPASTSDLVVVALGDSLTRGAGDAGGGGYPGRVAAALRTAGRTVTVENMGVDGFESADLLRKLDGPEVKSRIAAARLVLVSIGGNDLTHAVPAGSITADSGAAALEKTRANLLEIVRRLRAANPTAPLRLLGLYNPFPTDASTVRVAREALLRWNVAIEEASFSETGVVVVPIADVFEERPDKLSPDRFHPGPQGYDEIAHRVLSSLPSSLVPSAPREAAR